MKSPMKTGGVMAALLLFGAAFAYGQASRGPVQTAQTDKDNRYKVTILVSNEEEDATVTVDPLLQNAWGIAALPGGPWWVADNATGFSTIYRGDGTKLGLEVSGLGAPTGIVANTSGSFRLTDENTPAKFIFVSEDGTFTAWASGTTATVVHSEPGSIYKGLAIHGNVLYTTNFAGCEVEAYQGDFFNQTFDEFDTVGGFHDGTIPGGYCPFGIQAIGDSIFVTYAKKNGDDDEAGVGHGFVREFDQFGQIVSRVASHGTLNSPWGMAMAPYGFGKFGGCLLVGNFGDGKINAFCQNNGGWHPSGRLKEGVHLLQIDGLWGLGFGNDGLAGPSSILYFAAGPDDEANGYYGSIEFAPKN